MDLHIGYHLWLFYVEQWHNPPVFKDCAADCGRIAPIAVLKAI